LLHLKGHEAEIAGDAATALTAARRRMPDVALVDIGLPGSMDGWELGRHLARLPGLKRPLLVAVTGRDGDEDRAHSRAAGFDLHLAKPADPALLHRLLLRFQQIIAP